MDAARAAARGHPHALPSLARRLGQIGVLGWLVVLPALLGALAGRWLDRRFGSGVFFSAPLLMLGCGFGMWLGWRWIHRNGGREC
ncbi:MAG: AtpZ/AtpI family protein [Pseudomonadota bacterium]|nr:AtpZ/AtpI family protein [Pseudomonadota bacterium]